MVPETCKCSVFDIKFKGTKENSDSLWCAGSIDSNTQDLIPSLFIKYTQIIIMIKLGLNIDQ